MGAVGEEPAAFRAAEKAYQLHKDQEMRIKWVGAMLPAPAPWESAAVAAAACAVMRLRAHLHAQPTRSLLW